MVCALIVEEDWIEDDDGSESRLKGVVTFMRRRDVLAGVMPIRRKDDAILWVGLVYLGLRVTCEVW